ncbi:MAG: aminotransferase class III-fold pyridoxal phosphate-dependent enzyme [Candidatus Izimaplasma sp.]|nr:aminotransferase class III-fold pyridoxal phosphate-dependent enzyme [Candidatus Izimaplasma bacterium]
MSKIYEDGRSFHLYSWSAQNKIHPLVITDAEGVFIYDEDGNKYYDLSSQLVNMNIGHKHPYVIKKIAEQAEKLAFTAPFYASEVKSEAARRIIDVAPDNMGKVFFTNGGAEANEHALRIAKQYTGKTKILSGYYSYHGSTYGASSLSGDPRRFFTEHPPAPGFIKFLNPYMYRSPFPYQTEEALTEIYLKLLEEQIILENPDNIAAIWFEGVVGSNGVLIPPKGYYKGVRELCNKYNILMVIDDVMVGFGRTGKWFSCEHFDFQPDIITFAKGVTSGYVPLGGVIISKTIADYFEDTPMVTGLTYSGHPMGCATAIANMDVLKNEKLLENTEKMGKLLQQKLQQLKQNHPSIGDVRSIGLISVIEFVKNQQTKERLVPYGKDPNGVMKKIKGKLFENGLASFGRENLITVAPPLTITEHQLDDIFNRLEPVCTYADSVVREIS